MTKTCYCCDKPAVGRGDHVPPIGFFPKGSFSNRDPIIVPSCEKHNQEMSKADEYLRFILIATSTGVPIEVRNKVIRGVLRHVKKGSRNIGVYGLKRDEDVIKSDGSVLLDLKLLHDILDKIARGIYYHHSKGKKLIGNLAVYPIFLDIDDQASAKKRRDLEQVLVYTLEGMMTHPMIEVVKNLFSYQVVESGSFVAINMLFYGDKVVSVCSLREHIQT